MIEIGKRNTLRMVRKSDLGFMLTDGKEEILMHYKESLKELEENEQVTIMCIRIRKIEKQLRCRSLSFF